MQQSIIKTLKINILTVLIGFLSVNNLFGQSPTSTVANPNTQSQAPNLIIITTDGFRWQEVFGGMDSTINSNDYPPNPHSNVFAFLNQQAAYYLQTKKPKALYISYGETDEWAHHAHYRDYLDAAHQVDDWIAQIWNWVQSTPGYKDNTYLLVTTDHGRGFKEAWITKSGYAGRANKGWTVFSETISCYDD